MIAGPNHTTGIPQAEKQTRSVWHCLVPKMPRLKKASGTLRSSRAAPHPSTNRALRRLTSEFGRDPVHSTRYGRWRQIGLPKNIPSDFVWPCRKALRGRSRPNPKFSCGSHHNPNSPVPAQTLQIRKVWAWGSACGTHPSLPRAV